jgi:gas vesicle protein
MSKKNSFTVYFLLGAAAGSLLFFLYAARKGTAARKIIKRDNNSSTENSSGILQFFDEGIHHSFRQAVRKIDREIRSIRAGFSAAVKSIGRKTEYKFLEDVTEDFILDDKSFGFETDKLPKSEGMKRRTDHKRFS